MNRILLALAAVSAVSLCMACGGGEEGTGSQQDDGLVHYEKKVPAAQAQGVVDALYEAPSHGSACFPRTCTVSQPDADGNVVVLASLYCDGIDCSEQPDRPACR